MKRARVGISLTSVISHILLHGCPATLGVNDVSREVLVRVVGIGGIIDHYCLKLSFHNISYQNESTSCALKFISTLL